MWAWEDAFQFSQADFACSMPATLSTRGACSLKEPPQTTTAIVLGLKWRCLLLRIVLEDALSEVMKVYPPLKLKAFVDDISAIMGGQKQGVARYCGKGADVDKEGGSREGIKVVDPERGKRRENSR